MRSLQPDQTAAIYKATCSVDGRAYVGATCRSIERRWEEHCSDRYAGSPLANAILQHGATSFTLEQLACARGRPDTLAIETALVLQHNTIWPFGFNRTYGSAKHPTATQRGYRRVLARIEGNTLFWAFVMVQMERRTA